MARRPSVTTVARRSRRSANTIRVTACRVPGAGDLTASGAPLEHAANTATIAAIRSVPGNGKEPPIVYLTDGRRRRPRPTRPSYRGVITNPAGFGFDPEARVAQILGHGFEAGCCRLSSLHAPDCSSACIVRPKPSTPNGESRAKLN